ncbi:MAG: OB-fold domain-containing protein [Acidobacteriota bacterium]
MSGIIRYGSYVPFFRLDRKAARIGRGGERAVASYDEDSASMAVEASREALRGWDGDVDTMLFATTSPGYAEKLNAATVHAACNLPAGVTSIDVGGSSRGGFSALLTAFDMAAGGRTVLVCAGDVVVGAPSGPRETAGGDAASAFIVGPGDAGVQLIGRASATEEMLDVWKSEGMQFAKQWEERFGAEVYLPLIQGAFVRALEGAGIEAAELATVVLDGNNARALRTFAGKSGLGDRVADDLSARVGRSGVAHAGLLLANVLDAALPGQRIAVVSAADGVDVAILEVTAEIAKTRPQRTVERWLESKRADLPYQSYLKWRGILPFEPPRRPDPDRPAAPPMMRSEKWKYGFVASRCTSCGGAHLPPQRVCVLCGDVDKMEPEPYADAQCKIATYTIDRLAYSLQPPVIAAVVDYDPGGRFSCELTDVDAEKVGIGDELEMTFRRMFTAGGVHNYFWKARPQR